MNIFDWEQRTGRYAGMTDEQIERSKRMSQLARDQFREAEKRILAKCRADREAKRLAGYTRYDENGNEVAS